MSLITSTLGIPLGWIMYACYKITNNYVFSLFLFTLITRLILLPFTLKQQKSTAKMQMVAPEIKAIQKKYANNREKMNEETLKLYNSIGYNPMSGCLPLLIQFPILFGLIDVIYKPLTHIARISKDLIESAVAAIPDMSIYTSNQSAQQLGIIRAVNEGVQSVLDALGSEAVEKVQALKITVFGSDLTQTPSTEMLKTIFSDFNPVILIPILAGATSMLMSVISMRNSAAMGSAAGGMKGMMYTMPIFSLIFTFSVPAGVGVYWIFSNLIGSFQSFALNKVWNPKEMAEKAKIEMQQKREEERRARIEAKKNNPEKGLSKKESNAKKLAQARKKAAEKYGEEYTEE